MKRKRFTALKVTLTAMMLTAALTFGEGSAYAADWLIWIKNWEEIKNEKSTGDFWNKTGSN